MPLDPSVVGKEFPPVRGQWSERDCRIYALGVGAGGVDPTRELQFTTENSTGVVQQVLPTFGAIEGGRAGVGGLIEHLGVRVETMLHGDQIVEQHCPLPVSASVVTRARVIALWDKGKAAVVTTEATTVDAATGNAYCTCTQSMFLRGEGGWGGERGPPSPPPTPDGEPDDVFSVTTRPDQALLYRLTGDFNPLHSDPVAAARAGFAKPILHGMCVFGIAARELLTRYADGDPARFKSVQGRFTSPTLPGETLAISIWKNSSMLGFAVHDAQGALVLASGLFKMGEAG